MPAKAFQEALIGAFPGASERGSRNDDPEAPETIRGLGTVTDQIDPRFARVVRHANCFQSIFGSETSFDFMSSSQVTSSPV